MEKSVPLASVGVTDGYEHGTITCFLCARSRLLVSSGMLNWETFVIIFIVKKIYIQFVMQSENKMTSYLAHLFPN